MRLWMLLTFTATIVCADSLNCSYISLMEHLGVGPNNLTLSALRPIRDWRNPTHVSLDLYLQMLIDVDEKLQSVSTVIYILLSWVNELINWDPEDFCGIKEISVPKEYLWRPDISIDESTEVKLIQSEGFSVRLLSPGRGVYGENLRVTSNCRMDLYKFPFDTQQCKLSAIAIADQIDQLRLQPLLNASDVSESSLSVFRSQGEWDVVSIHVTPGNLTVGANTWDRVIYTITIKRRPYLYVINFLVPLLVFLVLDLVTYFMNESGGEKLGFKVTILLAISVLLLILHDILPSTTQKAPLIGVFCTGVFIFVSCSIVETITVSFLVRMASKCDTKVHKTPKDSDGATANQTAGSPVVSVTGQEKLAPPCASELHLILAELQVLRTHLFPDHAEDHGRACLRLKTVAKRINAVYFLLYLCAACVFIGRIGTAWSN